ncbi:MAG: hypothetical protein JO307_32305 [Bryobacterales bacterium]|nr:hypothetical protein [Bryobacterales bacterium]MBV9400326.1 hypothetical protein [Bryobacterales bacterium]
MYDQHEPSKEFVENLEWEIAGEVRRRNRSARIPRWMPKSGRKAAFALAGVVLVSMSLGGAGVAAAYQLQSNQHRDDVLAGLEQRELMAQKELLLARQVLDATQKKIPLGAANQMNVLENSLNVAQAEARVKSIESQIEEVRITGREPSNDISAPLVSGRDFVRERLQIDTAAPKAALDLEQMRVRDLERSVSIGAASLTDADEARIRVAEIEAALELFRRKLDIRKFFLTRKFNAAEAELRVLEAEAEQREKALSPKIDFARKLSQDTAAQARVGAASTMDQAEAAMRLEELEMERAKANLDLARVRHQLDLRRKGR